MDRQEMPYEEYPLLPEYNVPSEYTPVFPDVSFFQESFVTSREENVFRGETPPGEEDRGSANRKRRMRRPSFTWLRDLLGSALRGGAAVAALGMLVVAMVSAADLPERSPWGRVKYMLADLRGDAFRKPDDYGPDDLARLWNGDPEGPHQYDFEHVHIRREATCLEDGLAEYICTECGVALPRILPGGHSPAAAVKENVQPAGCTADGGYDEIVYCSVCHEELSREHRVYAAEGHRPAEAVTENTVGAQCTEDGHYDSVVYCTVCRAELSRETKTLAASGHIEGFAVKENQKEASCTEEGSYDSVVYCMVCGAELSRETVILPMTAHIETQDIEENRVEPTCTLDGSAEIAVYCDICGEELSRRQIVLEAAGHSNAAAVRENQRAPSCSEEGGYDTVVYCSVCGEELSRAHT
ncbi:MAG: hypothetical protein IKR43_03785, partial [Lachnospiraceae bacterium]|nr:hypothetical protein [Lachnospiraceae bacterium]